MPQKRRTVALNIEEVDTLGQIPVRWSVSILDAFQVLALYQALNTLLDHIHIGAEPASELCYDLAMELLVREFLTLPRLLIE
jgi:hypothetical protein